DCGSCEALISAPRHQAKPQVPERLVGLVPSNVHIMRGDVYSGCAMHRRAWHRQALGWTWPVRLLADTRIGQYRTSANHPACLVSEARRLELNMIVSRLQTQYYLDGE